MKSAFALIFFGVAAISQANLLVNGDFELPTGFVPDGNNTHSLAPGSNVLTGWTISTQEIAIIRDPNPFGITASSGIFSLDLMGYHDFQPTGTISQSFGTVIGETYTISFDIGRNTQLVASAGGVEVTRTNTNSTSQPFWNTESFSFVATSNLATLSIRGGAGTAPQYAGVDNIIVDGQPVPEPATIAIAGLVALAAARKKRRTN